MGTAKVASPGEDTPKAPRVFADPLRLPALASGDDAPHTLNALEGLLGLYGSLDRPAGSIDSIPLPRQTRTLPGSSMTSAVPASPPLMAASVV